MPPDYHYPLTSHAPAATLALTPDGPVSAARFIAEAQWLASRLPAGRHILNFCQDRYRFMTGLAASLISGKISLLPSTHTAESIRQMQAFAPDVFCLSDTDNAFDLPQLRYPAFNPEELQESDAVPLLPAEQTAAYVFTSGSTGLPVPHTKSWGALVNSARAEAARLGLDHTPCNIVGTVPPQHMYGLESTVMLALHGQCSCWSGRPFYPADIADALAQVAQPRLLVTTPFHLQALLDSGQTVAPLNAILSATAPLSTALAQRAEQTLQAPLREIYGCTETGQLATRRTTQSQDWELLPDIQLEQENGHCFASGGHINGRIALADLIELLPQQRFRLQGRSQDLVNIAGKRTSLAYLNHQLTAIVGIRDGCFFNPDPQGSDHINRLCAIVVAPEMSSRQIMAALRERIDPVFLPRPLIFVDAMPRNATGKLPRQELLAILSAHQNRTASARRSSYD